MAHENAKKGKLKTKVLSLMIENNGKQWQQNNIEIDGIRNDIENQRTDKFRVENDIVLTNDDKIWIPQDNGSKLILRATKYYVTRDIKRYMTI